MQKITKQKKGKSMKEWQVNQEEIYFKIIDN